MSGQILEGMTPDKLRFIATYISECDSIIGKLLRLTREQWGEASHITDEMLELIDGKAVQADLNRWADTLESCWTNE